jgi:hypothetical protein
VIELRESIDESYDSGGDKVFEFDMLGQPFVDAPREIPHCGEMLQQQVIPVGHRNILDGRERRSLLRAIDPLRIEMSADAKLFILKMQIVLCETGSLG